MAKGGAISNSLFAATSEEERFVPFSPVAGLGHSDVAVLPIVAFSERLEGKRGLRLEQGSVLFLTCTRNLQVDRGGFGQD